MSANTVTRAEVESVAVSKIVVGERRRKKLGAIQSLVTSIDQHGLIHPIVIDSDNVLVTGRRRLEAFKKLNRKSIPARRVGSLSSEELRALELDENSQRLDLDSYETSKARLREIEAAAETMADSARVPGKRGPRPDPNSVDIFVHDCSIGIISTSSCVGPFCLDPHHLAAAIVQSAGSSGADLPRFWYRGSPGSVKCRTRATFACELGNAL